MLPDPKPPASKGVYHVLHVPRYIGPVGWRFMAPGPFALPPQEQLDGSLLVGHHPHQPPSLAVRQMCLREPLRFPHPHDLSLTARQTVPGYWHCLK